MTAGWPPAAQNILSIRSVYRWQGAIQDDPKPRAGAKAVRDVEEPPWPETIAVREDTERWEEAAVACTGSLGQTGEDVTAGARHDTIVTPTH